MTEFYFQSSLVNLKLQTRAGVIVEADFVFRADIAIATLGELEQRALLQLQKYCQNAQQVFDLPLKPAGTEFQQRVWQALSKIPHSLIDTLPPSRGKIRPGWIRRPD